MFIDHTCRNRKCVNPRHLRVVTPTVNGLENNSNPWAINKAKTHCNHGHDITEPGSYYASAPQGNPCRTCKECARLTSLADKYARKLGLSPRPEWIGRKAA
jgi:hypothetical protein